jgi:hypothetical protein
LLSFLYPPFTRLPYTLTNEPPTTKQKYVKVEAEFATHKAQGKPSFFCLIFLSLCVYIYVHTNQTSACCTLTVKTNHHRKKMQHPKTVKEQVEEAILARYLPESMLRRLALENDPQVVFRRGRDGGGVA